MTDTVSACCGAEIEQQLSGSENEHWVCSKCKEPVPTPTNPPTETVSDLRLGDCLEVMKTMEDNSVDAVVTDPPYGLSFMGKRWDYDVPSVEIWKECLRVLKPGGYLLSFAGTRTQHRMAVRIEDAGFEIRDMIAWIYGSGFPKSLNIGKAVDKLQGNEREILPPKTFPDGSKDRKTANHKFYADVDSQENNFTNTKGTSEWEGWGTALKPALEPITVARKPLSEKNVAENVLKWGTGGINIDGSRVGTTGARFNGRNVDSDIYGKYGTAKPKEDYNMGRFPSNLIHDGSDEVVGLFPNTKGGGSQRGSRKWKGGEGEGGFGGWAGKVSTDHYVSRDDGTGSASRFFYVAKASRAERQGSTHPTMKPIKLMEYLVKLVSREGATVLDPFMGSGTTGIACKKNRRSFIGIEIGSDYFEIAKKRIQVTQETML